MKPLKVGQHQICESRWKIVPQMRHWETTAYSQLAGLSFNTCVLDAAIVCSHEC